MSMVRGELRRLRKKAELTLLDCARPLGANSASSYQHYEDRFKDKYLPLDVVLRLRPLFVSKGISEREFLALADPQLTNYLVHLQNTVMVPEISNVPAGGFAEALENLNNPLYHPIDYPNSTVAVLRVTGNSMDRAGLPDRSKVVIDYSVTVPKDGCIYVFRLNNEITIKRYRDNPPRLEPDSNEQGHETTFGVEGLECLGRAVKVLLDI
jgi:SOS-response transcriptional repressor LexA